MGRRILSETLPKRLRWAPEQRLEFIEFRLFWDGAVNRSDLMDRFGISEPQASKDLASYRELAANNLQYDSVSRVLGWQSRFRWILTPGNDIFVVYTHNWIDPTDPSARFRTLDRRAATKAVYTKRF